MRIISIVIPVYKVEQYLSRCVDSVLSQTFSAFETTLVDDGSPDICGMICDEYAMTDSHVFVIHKKNGGLSDARNAGIDWAINCSESKWITFIDSDDWIHSKYLEALFHAIIETSCKISICGYKETIDDEPNLEQVFLKPEIVDTETFFCKNNVNAVVAWGKLYKKDLFRTIRYPVGKLHEDEFTTYKLLFEHSQLSFISVPLYYYYQNNSSIIRSMWNPWRMALLEAIEESISFFYKKKHMQAYKFSLHKLALSSFVYYRNIVENAELSNMVEYLPRITRYLKSALISGKKYGLFPISEYIYLYETAFPKMMKLYWYGKAVKSKVKGDGRGKN